MNGWINTLDQLPPIGEEVLALDDKNKRMLVSRTTINGNDIFQEYQGHILEIEEVYFWQRLPEVPKDAQMFNSLSRNLKAFRKELLEKIKEDYKDANKHLASIEDDFEEMGDTLDSLMTAIAARNKEMLLDAIAKKVVTPYENWKYEFEKNGNYPFEFLAYSELYVICRAQEVRKCLS